MSTILARPAASRWLSCRRSSAIALHPLGTSPLRLGLCHRDALPAAHAVKNLWISIELAKDVDGACGPDLIAAACGRRPPKDAKRPPGRPVSQIPGVDHLARFLRGERHLRRKVNLIAPAIGPGLEGKRLPRSVGGSVEIGRASCRERV